MTVMDRMDRKSVGAGASILYKSKASVCATVTGDRRYFLAPCEARIPLADTLYGYRTVVSVSGAL